MGNKTGRKGGNEALEQAREKLGFQIANEIKGKSKNIGGTELVALSKTSTSFVI